MHSLIIDFARYQFFIFVFGQMNVVKKKNNKNNRQLDYVFIRITTCDVK